jgi:hypothetical protein
MDYLERLSDDDRYLFSVYRSDPLDDGVLFTLTVEPK